MVLQVKSGAINFSFKYFCQWFVEAAATLVVIHASFCRDSVAGFTRLRDNAASSITFKCVNVRGKATVKVSMNLLSTILE